MDVSILINQALNLIIIGIIFSVVIFYLLIFTGRKLALYNLYFALFALSLIITMIGETAMPYVFTGGTDERYLTLSGFLSLLGACLTLSSSTAFIPILIDCRNKGKRYINFWLIILVVETIICCTLILIMGYNTYIEYIFPYSLPLAAIITIALFGFFLGQIIYYKKYTKPSVVLAIVALYIIPITIFIENFGLLESKIKLIDINYSPFIFTVLMYAYQLSRKFNKEYRELEEKKLKNVYFTTLAHETKTPLTLISNYMDQYLKKHETNNELDIIKQNIDKLKTDMINLLDAEKLEQGSIFYDNTLICNLSTQLQANFILFQAQATKKNITATADIGANLYTKADPLAIERVVNNLLDNAIKYTHHGGRIHLALTDEETTIKISVTDNGPGISKEQLSKIFLPYYQISHEKRNTQGIGMGLHITRMIIDSLKGSITVNSKPGVETRFEITLNKHAKQKNEKAAAPSLQSDLPIVTSVQDKLIENPYDADKKTILVAEDNEQLLAFIKENLEKYYNVYYGKNGREALAKLDHITKPDVIISDVMMDEMDGHAFFHRLSTNEKYRDIPFIFLTAKTNLEDKIKALSRGAIDYLYKPFTIDELLSKLDALVKNQQLKQALYEKDKFATLGMLSSGICHEIANPLNLIYGPIDLLEAELNKLNIADTKNINLYIKRIIDNVKRIEKIIANMRLFSKQDDLQNTEIDFVQIVKSIREIFKNKLGDDITLSLINTEHLTVISDTDAMTHILMNLVANAIDAIDGAGAITITVEKKQNTIMIKVSDTGCGIAEDKLPLIFNAFYTGKKVGTGTGLGLYIVKDLIMKLGYTINVKSEINKGTEFIIPIK